MKSNSFYEMEDFLKAFKDYKGKIIKKAEFEETCINVQIDLDEMKQYRTQMPILKDTKIQYKIMEK